MDLAPQSLALADSASLKLETEHLKLASELQSASIHALRISCPDRIIALRKLNLCGMCNSQIFAIFLQKTGVGRGSA